MPLKVAAFGFLPMGGIFFLIHINVYSNKFSRSDAGTTTKPNIFKGHFFFIYIDLSSYQNKIIIVINKFHVYQIPLDQRTIGDVLHF